MGDSYRARVRENFFLRRKIYRLMEEVRELKKAPAGKAAGRRPRPKEEEESADFGKGAELSIPECRLGF